MEDGDIHVSSSGKERTLSLCLRASAAGVGFKRSTARTCSYGTLACDRSSAEMKDLKHRLESRAWRNDRKRSSYHFGDLEFLI